MNLFKSNCFVFCKSKLFISLFFLFFLLLPTLFHCNRADARGSEKIGVLYSYQNVESYKNNGIVGFNQAWKSFLETFEEIYLDSQFLCNFSPETTVQNIGVNVIFFPLAIDIDQDEQNFLDSFVNSGGKLIISSGIGPISENLKSFLSKHGIAVKENKIAKETLYLNHKVRDIIFDLPASNFYSSFELSGFIRKVAATWKETNQIAIGGTKNVVYIGYSWGQDIDKNKDIKTFVETVNYFWPELIFRLTKEITKEEYQNILKEVYKLKEEANSVTKIAEQLDLTVPWFQIRKHFDNGLDLLGDFNSNYLFGNYLTARESANYAKREFAIVYSLGVPVRSVEVRAVWVDRGTIVGMKDAIELRNYIKNLIRTGFNVIFFETINAGYPIYPSKLLPQNPQIKDWDPLRVAIDTAHASGAELHAWVWTFAVGNTKHNLILGQEVEYPGPIIGEKGRSWALAAEDGKLRVEMQPETWLSPANKEACSFLKEVFIEIVKNYDIDGLQFDYIRFPFQKTHSQVGFDLVTKNAFHQASGKFPTISGPNNKSWREWKALLISDFVKETSKMLKEIKPNLKLSAAVFALDRTLRMQLIQQDWETWLINHWIDAVYPFYYSFTKDEIITKLEREKNSINDKAIIIPGFNLRVLSLGELAERITIARNSGVLGFSLFAAEHLDKQKRELLQSGPFRERTVFIPYNNPLLACQKLLDEFYLIIEKFTLTKKISVLSESKIQKEVYYLTQDLKSDLKNYTLDKSSQIENKIVNLQSKVKDWLALEKYLEREERALYISSYLDQIKTLLNYIK